MLGILIEGERETQFAESSNKSTIDPSDIYGLALVQQISTEICNSILSKLVVPVAMIYGTEPEAAAGHLHQHNRTSRPSSGGFPIFGSKASSPRRAHAKSVAADPHWTLRCIDNGAIDVLTSPLQHDRLRSLTVHAYRAHKEASRERAKFLEQMKLRKRSWLGNNNDKPYAYLREAMYVPIESFAMFHRIEYQPFFIC